MAKKSFLSCLLIFSIQCLCFSQNGLIGSGFGANDWSTISSFSSSAGSSRIYTDNANGTGNQYFRTVINYGGNNGEYTITVGSNTLVTSNTEYTPNQGTTNGAMYLNVSSTSDWYVFKTPDMGNPPPHKLIIFKIQGAIQTVSSVSQSPTTANVYPGQAVDVTATISGSFSTGQSVYLRYSTDAWTSSSVIEMTGSGTSYSATIPGSSNTPSANINYYIFTSGNGLTISGNNADWYTINLNNNGSSNYSYTVNSSWISTATGNWSSGSTWLGGVVPVSDEPVTIANTNVVTLDANESVSSLTINSGGTFNGSSNTLTVSNGGTLTNNGTLTAASGTINFSAGGIATPSGTITFYNLTVGGATLDLSASGGATINNILCINSGGSLTSGHAPSYNSGSTLKYNTGGTFNPSQGEWYDNSGSGFGVPDNVQISNNTSIVFNSSYYRQLTGNLTIDVGSTLQLSSSSGGDLKIGGNFINSGTFTPNGRAVFFNGSGNQSIANSETFDYVIVDNGGFVQLSSSGIITINNQLNLTNGSFSISSSNILNIKEAATVVSTGGTGLGSANMIALNSSTAVLRKNFNASNTSFTFPVGKGSSYSPFTLTFSSATYSGNDYVDLNLNPVKYSGNYSLGNYLTRYWTLTPSGLSAYTYNITASYLIGDVVGTEASIHGGKTEDGGTTWTSLGLVNTTNHQFSGTGLTTFSVFTGLSNSALLPITLQSFTAKKIHTSSLLTWTSKLEVNADYFSVERSSNGVDFSGIGSVSAIGNSSIPNQYTFTDDQPATGINYYRLKMVDQDGKFEYSNIISLDFNVVQAGIRLFPNPGQDMVHLFTSQQPHSIMIFNSLGDLVKIISSEASSDGSYNIDTSDLPNGTYQVVASFDNGQKANTQWVLSR